MKKTALSIILSLVCMTTALASHNLFNFRVKTIEGKWISLSKFRGKKIIVVNVASKCGLTPEYSRLQTLYLKYKDRGLVILGFPANNFKEQEPGSDEEIRKFCSLTYNVTFPMMSKISVKGDDIHPLYKWLTEKSRNGVFDASVKWNFQKFLIDEQGHLVGYMEPTKTPDYDKLAKWIETGEWKQ